MKSAVIASLSNYLPWPELEGKPLTNAPRIHKRQPVRAFVASFSDPKSNSALEGRQLPHAHLLTLSGFG
jgi:hypothetical protein